MNWAEPAALRGLLMGQRPWRALEKGRAELLRGFTWATWKGFQEWLYCSGVLLLSPLPHAAVQISAKFHCAGTPVHIGHQYPTVLALKTPGHRARPQLGIPLRSHRRHLLRCTTYVSSKQPQTKAACCNGHCKACITQPPCLDFGSAPKTATGMCLKPCRAASNSGVY